MSFLCPSDFLARHNTTFKREFIAACTTFVTMAYIVTIAPHMLAQAGVPYGAAFTATCLVVIVGSILSACFASLPVAFAPGLGLLSFFSYVVVAQLHYSWKMGLGMVFVAGVIFFLLTVSRIRQVVLQAIPPSLGSAIAAGIGFFIAFIALRNVHLVVSNSHTLLALGVVHSEQLVLFFTGFVLIAVLDAHQVPGAILLGILGVTLLSTLLGLNPIDHWVSLPSSLSGSWLHMSLHGWHSTQWMSVVFTFVIVALFDSTGTLLALTQMLPQQNEKARYRQINRGLLAESVTTVFSALLGSTTVSPMVENSAGLRAGGRTGVTALLIALFFCAMLFLSPLAKSIPIYATSSALFYVGCLMVKPFAHVDWHEPSEYIPAVITLLMIPLTFSISDGVGLGLICYTVLKVASGKWKNLHPFIWVLTVVFLVYFVAGNV